MIEGTNKTIQRIVYAFGNLVGVGLAVYKCQVMGLLPTHASDWLAFVEPQKVRMCSYVRVYKSKCILNCMVCFYELVSTYGNG